MKTGDKIVIGIMGTIASGKGTIARYLAEKHGFKHVVMGDLVRAIARKQGIKPTRENLHNLQARYRAKDPAYFIKKVIARILKEKQKKWVVDGLRNPEDARELKKAFDAKLILVDAPVELRWKRARERKRGEEAKESLKDFIKTEQQENKIFRFNITKRYADFKIINAGSKKQVFSATEKVLKKILS
jgi:dephospho-CoA kinase